jgi:hypothetical protein
MKMLQIGNTTTLEDLAGCDAATSQYFLELLIVG